MARDYDLESILGVPFEETPETMAYDLSSRFSAQVMNILDDRNMSMKDLADEMGITQPSLCKMLGGRSNMTMKTVAKIAIALGCDLEPPALQVKPRERNIPGMESRQISKELMIHMNPSRRKDRAEAVLEG